MDKDLTDSDGLIKSVIVNYVFNAIRVLFPPDLDAKDVRVAVEDVFTIRAI